MGNTHNIKKLQIKDKTQIKGKTQKWFSEIFICVLFRLQDTELLLQQLSRDQEAVDEVKTIVEEQEATMKRETKLVQDYAEVRADFISDEKESR